MNWFSKIQGLAGQEYERYLPSAFDGSLTLLEKVNKVIETLNQIVLGVNTVADYVDGHVDTQNEKITQLRDDFEILKDWLENEGLEERTEQVLNEWFDNGRLAQIINSDVFNMKVDKTTFEQFVLSTASQLQQKASLTDIANLTSATPLFADDVVGMVDTSKPYVNMADGYIYLYVGGVWTKTTVLYQGTNYGATTMNNIVRNTLFDSNAYWDAVLSDITTRENASLTIMPSARFGQIKTSIVDVNVGDILYAYVQVKSTSNLTFWDMFRPGSTTSKQYIKKYVSGNGNFEQLSGRFEVELNTTLEFRVLSEQTSDWSPITISKPLVVNLTTIFGAGNEPELDDFEELLHRHINRIFFPDTFTASITPIKKVFPIPATKNDIERISTSNFNIELENGVITVDNGYIEVSMGKRGPNNIFDFNKFVINGVVSGVSSDFFGPYVVRAVQNINGDNPNSNNFTGGNHAYDNSGVGNPTGRTSELLFYVDGEVKTNYSGYANNLTIVWKNRIQAYNTTKTDGTGREVLEEVHVLSYDGDTFFVKNMIEAFEPIVIENYYGLQAQYLQWSDGYRFEGGLNRKWIPPNTYTNSGNKATSAILLKSVNGDILELAIDKAVDLGNGNFNDREFNAFTSSSKAYYRLVTDLTCDTGDIYTLAGHYRFYKT